jgi:sugar/nucleoside kinase (ribokinase family)
MENSKSEINELTECGGGPAANAAYLLSRWGIETAFAGLIGDDSYGLKIFDEFKTVYIDTSLLEMRHSYVTPLSIIVVNKQNGSRTIINRKFKSSFLSNNYLEKTCINPKIMLFDGHEPDASIKAMQAFPGAITVLDAGSLREGTEVLSRKVDYLVSSERFALSVTGLPDLESKVNQERCIEELAKINERQVVVTLGERGLIYSKDSITCHMPAFPAKTIDTTAAGDIFHGAFVYGLLKDMSLVDTLRLASMAASKSVQIEGGRNSIPELESVLNTIF